MPRVLRAVGGALGRTGLPVVLLACYAAAYVVWFVLTPAGPTRTFWSDTAFLPPGVVGLVAGVALLRRGGATGRARAAWTWITAAVACRLFADTAWWWLDAVRQVDPFPSTADLGYAAFYPCLLVGLFLLGADRTTTARQRWLDALDVLAVGAAAFTVMWYCVLSHVVAASTSGLAGLLNVYYPVADVLLAAAAARVAMRGGGRSAPVVLLLLACALFVVADAGFAYLSTFSAGTGGTWVDLFWVTAVTSLAAAVTARRHSPSAPARPAGPRASRLPLAAVLVAATALLSTVPGLEAGPVQGVAVAAVLLMAVTGTRQLVANREYADLAARYRLLATRDVLTGVASRGEGMAQGEVLVQACSARDVPCSVLMLDMNLFKQINDDLGHPAGDAALVAVAQRVEASVRTGDLVSRYGGDEFLVVLPGADAAVANGVARRIEETVAGTPVVVGDVTLALSVTVGAATGVGAGLAGLVHEADAALLARKSRRRRARRG